MLNSYRFAIVLMVLFGVVGIQAARHQSSAQLADATACANSRPISSSKTTVATVEAPSPNAQTVTSDTKATRSVHPVNADAVTPELASNDSL